MEPDIYIGFSPALDLKCGLVNNTGLKTMFHLESPPLFLPPILPPLANTLRSSPSLPPLSTTLRSSPSLPPLANTLRSPPSPYSVNYPKKPSLSPFYVHYPRKPSLSLLSPLP